jgi:hypothetical protein
MTNPRQTEKFRRTTSKIEDDKLEEPEIHIAIDARGNITVETVGTRGNQCDLLSGSLEARLGKTVKRENKDVYYDG